MKTSIDTPWKTWNGLSHRLAHPWVRLFIGMNCLVLKGVCIGQGSVVGAGSVVTMDVPAQAVVACNPARLVRSIQVAACESR